MDKGVGKNQKVSSGTFKTEIWAYSDVRIMALVAATGGSLGFEGK
jgi:hypothetical protein